MLSLAFIAISFRVTEENIFLLNLSTALRGNSFLYESLFSFVTLPLFTGR